MTDVELSGLRLKPNPENDSERKLEMILKTVIIIKKAVK